MTEIHGVDFTSRPSNRKPITRAVCQLDGRNLHYERLDLLTSIAQFDEFLCANGPWVAGLDFPFGQSLRFIENMGWPGDWPSYVGLVSEMSRREFRSALDAYRLPRATGDKEHKRLADVATRAVSPQKLYGVPVGLMFYEGASRLLQSGVSIPGVRETEASRVVFEAYPGVFARRITGSGYKSDTKAKQTREHRQARDRILRYLTSADLEKDYGLTLSLDGRIDDDPTGDTLDALICAVQAAWAWRNLPQLLAALTEDHRREGWIADPTAFEGAI